MGKMGCETCLPPPKTPVRESAKAKRDGWSGRRARKVNRVAPSAAASPVTAQGAFAGLVGESTTGAAVIGFVPAGGPVGVRPGCQIEKQNPVVYRQRVCAM